MAQFNGFVCDSCGQVFRSEDRTKKTVKYDGPTVEGETTQDLCPGCATDETEGLDLKPLRRRRVSAQGDEQDTDGPGDPEPQPEPAGSPQPALG